jgi:hypothetical protein
MENKFKTSEMSTDELLRALDTAREDMEVYELQRTLELNPAPQNERFRKQSQFPPRRNY